MHATIILSSSQTYLVPLQATELVLDRFSQIAVGYCQTFYKLELVWWRQLLDDLLHRISTPGEATTAAELPMLCSVYKG